MADIWDDTNLPSRKATNINTDRMETYGHPYPNHAIIASLWSVYLGVSVGVEDVSAMMILLKLGREKTGGFNYDYYDNVEDIAGFANTLYAVKEVRRERDAAVDDPADRARSMGAAELPRRRNAAQSPRGGRGAGGAKPPLSQDAAGDQG